MKKRELQREIKMKKIYDLLNQMNVPVSMVELERINGKNHSAYNEAFRILAEEGLIVRAGDRRREKLWIAAAPKVLEEINKTPSLADAHFVYNVNRYAEKHIKSARLARLEKKSDKVYVSGAQAYG